MNFGVAAMTMVYNEAYFLPAWCRHYGAQLGYENLLVLDHGSDDGSTANLPCRKMDLPRGVLDEEERAAMPARTASRTMFCKPASTAGNPAGRRFVLTRRF